MSMILERNENNKKISYLYPENTESPIFLSATFGHRIKRIVSNGKDKKCWNKPHSSFTTNNNDRKSYQPLIRKTKDLLKIRNLQDDGIMRTNHRGNNKSSYCRRSKAPYMVLSPQKTIDYQLKKKISQFISPPKDKKNKFFLTIATTIKLQTHFKLRKQRKQNKEIKTRQPKILSRKKQQNQLRPWSGFKEDF